MADVKCSLRKFKYRKRLEHRTSRRKPGCSLHLFARVFLPLHKGNARSLVGAVHQIAAVGNDRGRNDGEKKANTESTSCSRRDAPRFEQHEENDQRCARAKGLAPSVATEVRQRHIAQALSEHGATEKERNQDGEKGPDRSGIPPAAAAE